MNFSHSIDVPCNLLEMQIPEPYPRSMESGTLRRACHSMFSHTSQVAVLHT